MANNKMLIDAGHPEETRVAVVKGNRVDEFDFESEHKTQLRGNIYLAKVTRVEPSLQAAFVDFGGNRHGFLAFSEIHPDYYQIPVADRQALLEEEEQDAREAAAAENALDEEIDEADAAEESPKPRKRRSRRRSKKASAEYDSQNDDENENAESTDEETDDDGDVQAAENDGDDVVSEEAATEEKSKPKRRRVSRKKKETDGSDTGQPASKEGDADEAADKPKTRARRTTRKKKNDEDTAAEAEAVQETSSTQEQDEPEEKPKRRTSRRRKKVDEEAADTADTSESTEQAQAIEEAEKPAEGDSDEAPKKRPARSRRRRSAKTEDDNTETSEDDDNGDTPVEEIGTEDALEEVPTRRMPRRNYKIQEVIKRRQILLVQVVKEERGNKGAALTTYLSLAGRYSVLMPNTGRGGGISRKITNAADRKRLKSIASQLDVPKGMGVILRTAGASRKPEEIQRDFEYLMRLWENVRTLTLQSTAPCLVYEEGSLIKRSIRDLYDTDTSEILVDGEAGYREASDFMAMLMPDHAEKVKRYKDRIPLFARMGVEAQLDAMLQPQVTLKSGGYIIIDQTEALVAIDVNSGKSTRQHSVEETATQTNLEAADEIARQLRLRDLAGLIVIDFIDMDEKRNNRQVEKRLKEALKHDRARIQMGRISHFGLMEMSRQRIRASVLESTTQPCPICDGLGHVRSSSSVVLGVLRAIEEQLNRSNKNDLTVRVSPTTALYLLNNKRESLSDFEQRFGVRISIETDPGLGTQPCVIERGGLSDKQPANGSAIQPDSFTSEDVSEDGPEDEKSGAPDEASEASAPRKRRRRRRRKGGDQENEENVSGNAEETAQNAETSEDSNDEEQGDSDNEKPKRRRTSRRKAQSEPDSKSEDAETARGDDDEGAPAKSEDEEPSGEVSAPPRSKRRRKAPVKAAASDDVALSESRSVGGADSVSGDRDTEAGTADDTQPSKRRTSRPRRRTSRIVAQDDEANTGKEEEPEANAVAANDDSEQPRRTGWWNRKFF